MQVLLDTNILIKREDYDVISSQVQELFRLISRLDHKIVIHPLSKKEMAKDKDSKRRKIGLSKIGT